MNRRLKRWIFGLLLAALMLGTVRFYYHLTDDFRLSNMTYDLPFEAPWQAPLLTVDSHQQLAEILNQKFTYIGKGAQSYAFASEDQQYVLKFFKFKHLKPNLLIDLLPTIPPFKGFKQSCVERKKRKLISVFNGYDLAYKEHRQTSAIVYLHLVKTQDLNLNAKIVDKIGIERNIHLDDVVFLVQKKGETLRTRLNYLLEQERLQEAKEAIGHILAMYISEYKKGIFDQDHGVMCNTGFIGDAPFHLDVGQLNKDESIKQVEFYKKDLANVLWRMDGWIKSAYPKYYQQLSQFLSQEYHQWTGESLDIQSIDPKIFKKRR